MSPSTPKRSNIYISVCKCRSSTNSSYNKLKSLSKPKRAEVDAVTAECQKGTVFQKIQGPAWRNGSMPSVWSLL